ncbi:MAG: hypothetical protein IJX38_03730 [Clostridia bacterium]|nr:hypothetical protein [Clostridia bacterium]
MSKLNAEQIKKALERCTSEITTENNCDTCPYKDKGCNLNLLRDALALLCEYEERIEDLETLLFAFVLEMGITHADRQGKNRDQISDRVLEVIREKEKRVFYPQMRKRMQEAKARLGAKEATEDAEE